MRVAFLGEQCAGKTTALNYCIKEFGGKQVKFIESLYQINEVLGVGKNRGFMQEMGELVRKYFGQDFFANDFIRRTQYYIPNLFSDDARTEIEFNALKKAGFITVYIDADVMVRMQRSENLGLDFIEDHPIERGIKALSEKCDFVISNNGSIKDFYKKIHDLVVSLSQYDGYNIREVLDEIIANR